MLNTHRHSPLRFTLDRRVHSSFVILLSSIFMYACSGDSSVSSQDSAVVLEGTVLTSSTKLPISTSTEVFIDHNQNFILDDNETLASVKPHIGQFTLEIPALTPAQLESSFLVARNSPVPGQTYYLASPLAAYVSTNPNGGYTSQSAVISPLTSLVAGEMLSNQQTLAEATSMVNQITKNSQPLENYVLSSNNNAAQLAQSVISSWKPASTDTDLSSLQSSFTNNSDITKGSLLASHQDSINSSSISFMKPSAVPNGIVNLAGSSFVVVYKQGGAGNPNDHIAANNIRREMEVTGQEIARKYGGTFKFAYSSAIRGFSLAIPNVKVQDFVDGMQRNPNVDFIEEDFPVHLDAGSQVPLNWGLDRIDQNNLPLNHSYSYTNDGTGVNAYIVDTGLNSNHQEFSGRVNPGFSSIQDDLGTTDCRGHGTHVAGIVGGSTYGVAKNIKITPIKIFDCNGTSSISGIVAGIDWIIQNGRLPGVINMSIGISVSHTIDQAVNSAYDAGYVVVASAGNFAGRACDQSPARASKVITVGSSDVTDVKSYYSNYGVCVDVFAPGSSILSSWFSDNTASKYLNGTSMSSPHVAGVAALILQSYPNAKPQEINYAILNASTKNVMVGDLGTDSPNRLLRITNAPDFTPFNQPIYIPPINTPLPPIPPEDPPSRKPKIDFRIAAIKSISAQRIKVTKSTWKTNTTITIYASNKGPVHEATVTIKFSVGGANLTCTTNSAGVCSIPSGVISSSKKSTVLTVTGLSGENLGYLAKINKVKTLTIKKP